MQLDMAVMAGVSSAKTFEQSEAALHATAPLLLAVRARLRW